MNAKWQGTCPSFVMRKRSFWRRRNFTFSNVNCRREKSGKTNCWLITKGNCVRWLVVISAQVCEHLSSAQRYRRKKFILHPVHRSHDLLKHLLLAFLIHHFHLVNKPENFIGLLIKILDVIRKYSFGVHNPSFFLLLLFLNEKKQILTPISKRALTGLWSLVWRSMWLRYLSCLTPFPLQRILSHQAGTRHFPLQESIISLDHS